MKKRAEKDKKLYYVLIAVLVIIIALAV